MFSIIFFLLIMLTFLVVTTFVKKANAKAERERLEELERQYKSTIYYQETNRNFVEVRNDLGLSGEFLLSVALQTMPGLHHMLFNVYLPTPNGRTTKVDLIALADSGIFVFESKNYGGWIFGSEKSKNWCQSLPHGEKHFFYNPILQNKGHIKQLARTLAVSESRMCSVIVFSDECEFKELDVESAYVIKLSQVEQIFSAAATSIGVTVTPQEIEAWYQLLQPYEHASSEVKARHIADVAAIK